MFYMYVQFVFVGLLLIFVIIYLRITSVWGRHDHDRMVVRFTTTHAISTYPM